MTLLAVGGEILPDLRMLSVGLWKLFLDLSCFSPSSMAQKLIPQSSADQKFSVLRGSEVLSPSSADQKFSTDRAIKKLKIKHCSRYLNFINKNF